MSSKARRMPWMAARVSRMSCWVSMSSTSAPPCMSPLAWVRIWSASWSKVMPESFGSSVPGSMPVGPMDPITNRGIPSAASKSSHALRATLAAATLISVTNSARLPPSGRCHSSRRMAVAWNELVSTACEPASRYDRWISSSTSGRVMDR